MPGLSPAATVQVRLSLARALRAAGSHAEARAIYRELLEVTELRPSERLELRLQLAHAAVQGGDATQARAGYAAIAADAAVPPYGRSYARLLMARCDLAQQAWGAAKAEYERLLQDPQVPDSHQLEARERLAEVARLEAGRPADDPTQSRTPVPPLAPAVLTVWVAPTGSDDGPGTVARPLATLQGARDLLRARRAAGTLPVGPVVVKVQPGEYVLAQTFSLEARDTGSEASPISYQASERGTARFTGGVSLTGFRPVTDPAVLARLPEEARGKVMQVDLRARGVSDFGQLKPHGFGFGAVPHTELYCNGRPLTLARWPNDGYVKTGPVAEPATADRSKPVVFGYEGDRPARWGQAKDAWLFGFFKYLWADAAIGPITIDAATHRFQSPVVPNYGVVPGAPYYAYNLLEETDQPGEWYLDRTSGIAYCYPPADPGTATMQLSVLSQPMVSLKEVSWVRLEGLLFELGRADGIIIEGGEHCLVGGCTVRRLGGTAVTVRGGKEHGVLGCDLYTLGRNGTSIAGGDRKTLTPGGHFVENCHIHDFSRIDRTYTPAVWMDGVANRIVHNVFHDSPGHAMRIEGNDHVIEYNEIYGVIYDSDDQGGVDMFANPSYRGVRIRYNFWHHIGAGDDTPCGQAGVRLDDAISGVVVYGNVFYRCSGGGFGGVQIHGGKDNMVENNVFVNCKNAVSFSAWGPERWKSFLAGQGMQQTLHQTVAIDKPPYSTRYPALARLAEDEGVNGVWRNLVVNCGGFLARDRGVQQVLDNVLVAGDPGFADAAQMDFRLKPTAAVLGESGFRPIPFGEIGLYQDAYRASWPVPRARAEHYKAAGQ